MNIFLQEVKSNLRSLVYWTVGICVLLIVFMSIFTTISKDMAAMNKILESFPPEFAKALGLSEIDLSQLIGYYGFLFVYVLLTGGIFAMKLGISSLSEEIRTKTSDFLLVKPVRRHVIVSAKLLSVLVLLIAQNLAFFAVSAFTVSALRNGSDFDWKLFSMITLSLFFTQLFFASLGSFIAAFLKKIRTVLPMTLGIVFGFFVIQMVNESLKDRKLEYLTPFAWFRVPGIIDTGSYDMTLLAINFISAVVFVIAAYVIYQKKDMPSI